MFITLTDELVERLAKAAMRSNYDQISHLVPHVDVDTLWQSGDEKSRELLRREVRAILAELMESQG